MNNVDQRAVESKTDPVKKEKLIEDYIPFILSCAQKATGRYIDTANDEEFSVALEAFSEAIESFNIEKGTFLSFSNQVIKNRLYDYMRKTEKYNETVVFDDIYNDDSKILSFDIVAAAENYQQEMQRSDLVIEIDLLSRRLAKWDISFNDLSKISPKHKKTRQMCIKISEYILKNDELYRQMMSSKQLPSKQIENTFKLPKKKFERFRKYIIAVVIIKSGDFEQIAEYVKLK